ncbi:hypothetical protein [Streptosporangium sp. NPDC020145]|uniref:hypothetical protein n=1 Tax=Streptosporangium sp. NPDC020145 TaxID=3154694 RepID=UPI003417E960
MANKSGFCLSSNPHRLVESPREEEPAGGTRTYDLVMRHVWETQLQCGIKFSATRAAIYYFDFSEYPPAVSKWEARGLNPLNVKDDERDAILAKRMQVMNAFCLFLHNAHLVIEGRYVAPSRPGTSDIIHVDSGGAGGLGLNAMARINALSADGDQLLVDPVPIPLSVIQHAVKLLDDTMSADPKAVELAALIGRALTSSAESDFPAAVVMGWSACEFFIHKKWREYYSKSIQGRTGVLPSSKDSDLLSGRDFTASIVTQILRVANLLSEGEVTSLNQVRKQRNDWAHSIKSPRREASVQVVELAVRLFAEAYGVEFKVNANPVDGYAF